MQYNNAYVTYIYILQYVYTCKQREKVRERLSMSIIKEQGTDTLKMMSGDSGTLAISGLSTDHNLSVRFWLIDAESGALMLDKRASSNNSATVNISLSTADTKSLCLVGMSKTYDYGITLSGETYGTHTVIPTVGTTKKFIVYRSGT